MKRYLVTLKQVFETTYLVEVQDHEGEEEAGQKAIDGDVIKEYAPAFDCNLNGEPPVVEEEDAS